MLDNNQIQQAISATIAAEILKGLDTDVRNALLQKSIAEALTSFSVTDAIRKVVSDRAADVAKDMAKSGPVADRIAEAVQVGMDKFIAELPVATCKAMREAFAGSSETYQKGPGLLLKHLGK